MGGAHSPFTRGTLRVLRSFPRLRLAPAPELSAQALALCFSPEGLRSTRQPLAPSGKSGTPEEAQAHTHASRGWGCGARAAVSGAGGPLATGHEVGVVETAGRTPCLSCAEPLLDDEGCPCLASNSGHAHDFPRILSGLRKQPRALSVGAASLGLTHSSHRSPTLPPPGSKCVSPLGHPGRTQQEPWAASVSQGLQRPGRGHSWTAGGLSLAG